MKKIMASLIDSDGFAAVLSALRGVAQDRAKFYTGSESKYWAAISACLAQLQVNEAHHKTANGLNTYANVK